MTRDLHSKLGSVTPENLFAGLEPSPITKTGTIRKLGTANDEAALVYVTGNFNEDELILKSGASLTEADRDALRVRGILLGSSETEKVQ